MADKIAVILGIEDLAQVVAGVRWLDEGPSSLADLDSVWSRQTSSMKAALRKEARRYIRAFVKHHNMKHTHDIKLVPKKKRPAPSPSDAEKK